MSFLSITFQNINWWLVLVTIILGGFLFFSYRHFSRKKAGTTLLLLRTCFFLGVIFLWCKPQVNYRYRKQQSPMVLTWVDNSLSMAAQEKFSAKLMAAHLSDFSVAVNQQGGQVIFQKFSRELAPVKQLSELSYDGHATNITRALKQGIAGRSQQNIVAGLFISDGVFNQGENPLYAEINSGFPIYSVGIGDSLISGDPAVTRLQFPPLVKIGDTVSFRGEIVPQSERKNITLSLSVGERTVHQKAVPAEQRYFKKEVTFYHVFKEKGTYRVKLSISDKNDQNPYNNQRLGIIKVKAAAQNILLLSSQINFETRFLQQVFKEMEQVTLIPLVSHGGGWLPDSLSAYLKKDWDLVTLMGFPSAQTSQKTIRAIQAKFNEAKNWPLLIFIDAQTALEKLEQLLGYSLAQKYERANTSKRVTAQISTQGAQHPIMRNTLLELNDRSWQALPPIGYPYNRLKLSDGFKVLITTEDLTESPLIAVGSPDAQRIGLFCGSDFWRWRFMTQGALTVSPYTESLLNMFSWLTATEQAQTVQISPDKEVYLKGESMQLSGYVSDVKGDIIPEARVEAEAHTTAQEVLRFTIPWTGDKYATEVPLRTTGEYQLSINAYNESYSLGHTGHSFTVTEQPLELIRVYQNTSLLEAIARKTGGAKINLNAINQLVQNLSFQNKKTIEKHSLQLWRWPGSFIMLVLLLLGEWIIRRIKGYQ